MAELFETTPVHIQNEVVECLDVVDEEIVLIVVFCGTTTGPGCLELYRNTSDLIAHVIIEFSISVVHFVGLRIHIKVSLIVLMYTAFGFLEPLRVLHRRLLVKNRGLESDASSAAVEWGRGFLLLDRWVVSAVGHLGIHGED